MENFNRQPVGGPPADVDLTPEHLTSGEFAESWQLISQVPECRPSAGFAERLTARLRSEMASRGRTKVAAPLPMHEATPLIRLWPIAAGLAAAFVAAAWIGLGFLAAPTDDPMPVAVTPPADKPAEAAENGSLAGVESVPADVLAAVDGLLEIRSETEMLEQRISAIGHGPVLTASSLNERFPFLENTFEETLDEL